MKRHSSASSRVLAVLAVLGLAGPVAAGEQVPFKGSLAGGATLGPPDLTICDGIVGVAVNATGVATHLGQFALAIPHNVDLTTTPGTSCGFYEFEAANGATLFASLTGQVSPIPGVPGSRAASESATIIGSTGRFAGATGDFTVERVVLVDPATGIRTTIGSFEGTISSPGAARRRQR